MSRSPGVAAVDAPTSGRLPIPLTALFDLVAVTVFVLIGRASHEEGLAIVGVLQTLWPFVVAAAAGWSIVYVLSHVRSSDDGFGHDFRPERPSAGVTVWFCTVVVAMILRYLLHQGVAVSFVIVATIVLGLFLIGWRVAVSTIARRRGRVTA
ncbi:DUF3054 domain-containing protein [Gordonia insulae]|uniref:DUF3054 domain-containing protein n=1 Tax=Gordonia insulae TaxID=2420509 RepID=A0A3G8JPC5_9ACTN|nr:DUF3054 domain-containing protein [Gordonia insulae]AZG46372.1 hypothetical protein D7316_02973 [Gordonia insulae]